MNTNTVQVARLRPIDTLEDDLLQCWHTVSQATQRFLTLLREFDLRQGWRAYGNVDCADWLNWKCGISRVTAQEKVRVAHALWNLPQVDEAFARGDLSYSKVRALTRVGTGVDEAELLDFSLGATAASVEAFCRRLRNGDATMSVADARRAHESRSLVRHFREDGSGTLSVELPAADLQLVLKALEQISGALPDDPTRSLFAKGADALVHMAQASLEGKDGRANGSPANAGQVVIHVDASALDGQGGESDAPLPTVQRLICDGAIVAVVDGADGQPLSVGRRQRTVTAAIKRALWARDRGCVFPGCHHERYVDAHHVQHWANGGETSLGNLLLLCGVHHRLVHEGGFTIERHRDGYHYFKGPDGRLVDVTHGGTSPADRENAARRVDATGNDPVVEETHGVYRVRCLPRKTTRQRSPDAAPSSAEGWRCADEPLRNVLG